MAVSQLLGFDRNLLIRCYITTSHNHIIIMKAVLYLTNQQLVAHEIKLCSDEDEV